MDQPASRTGPHPAPRPALWSAIAATLQAEIGAGHLRPGDRLPTEAALAQRFGVNRHTVRRALADLAEAGLVHARRGAGVFVTAQPTDYPLGPRVRFHQNLTAAGKVPGRKILSLTTRHADAAEAQALRLTIGDAVHACEGLSLADGAPIALFRSIFPAQRLPDLPQLLSETGSVTQALSRHGVPDYTRASTRLRAITADAAQAAHLQIRPGGALLESVAINHDPQGQPVEYGITWFAGEKVTLTVPGADTLSQE